MPFVDGVLRLRSEGVSFRGREQLAMEEDSWVPADKLY